MLNRVKLKNFGPLTDINWSGLGKINLVIGGNGSGKTFLLKALTVLYGLWKSISEEMTSEQLRKYCLISYTGHFKLKKLETWLLNVREPKIV